MQIKFIKNDRYGGMEVANFSVMTQIPRIGEEVYFPDHSGKVIKIRHSFDRIGKPIPGRSCTIMASSIEVIFE